MTDWNTMNFTPKRPNEREIEILRRRYIEHRDALLRMATEAPTELLAHRYDELRAEIQVAIDKLNDVERVVGAAREPSAGQIAGSTPPNVPRTERATSAPLSSPSEREAQSRTAIIIGVGLLVLTSLGLLAWKFLAADSPDRQSASEIAESSAEDSSAAADLPEIEELESAGESDPATPRTNAARPRVASSPKLTIEPRTVDFGAIRKGSRVVRQIELTNDGLKPMSIHIERSECRCLWFEYPGRVNPKETVTLTVILDGSRAGAGALSEEVNVLVKNDPTVSAAFTLTATLQ